MANTDSKQNTVAWKDINWRKVELNVFKLQKRIYQASKNDNVKKLRRLQKTLLNSYSAKLLALRKVSQNNQGKKTAGIDGVKSLTPTSSIRQYAAKILIPRYTAYCLKNFSDGVFGDTLINQKTG